MIGILALQGDYPSHEKYLRRVGQTTRQVRTAGELEGLDALVLPGGESTTMLKLLERGELEHRLLETLRSGIPVFATCAGMILLAREVSMPEQRSFGLLDCHVQRNGYGRQIHSGIHELSGENGFPDSIGIFIRAPRVLQAGAGCTVLARRGSDPVLLEQGHILAASFHPELDDGRHPALDRFVERVEASAR